MGAGPALLVRQREHSTLVGCPGSPAARGNGVALLRTPDLAAARRGAAGLVVARQRSERHREVLRRLQRHRARSSAARLAISSPWHAERASDSTASVGRSGAVARSDSGPRAHYGRLGQAWQVSVVPDARSARLLRQGLSRAIHLRRAGPALGLRAFRRWLRGRRLARLVLAAGGRHRVALGLALVRRAALPAAAG